MKTLRGRPVVTGRGRGHALVSRLPLNFTAAFSQLGNVLPWRRGVILDRHHELFQRDIRNRVLVFPTCIGSTFTGMVLLQLLDDGAGPAAMVVQQADSLLVSGPLLGRAWFGRSFPVIEYPGSELFDAIRTGDRVEVDGETGAIRIEAG